MFTPADCNFHDVSVYVMNVIETRDYCEADDFEPGCGDNSVVVMTTARYGRMRLGSCVREDLGHVGCKSDVLPHVDWRCSAKPSCKIRIPDGELDQTRPCPGELKTYLEASYICVQGQCIATFTLGVFYDQHAGCMQAAYAGLSGIINAGQSGVDDELSGVDARMHPAASCQSI